MLRSDFQYELPDELIARHPAARRSDSRLLHLDGRSGALADLQFTDLPSLLRGGDLLVFNDTRVIPARLRGHKATGGRVELLLERVVGAGRALVQLRSSKPPAAGALIHLPDGGTATVVGREDDFWLLDFGADPAAVEVQQATVAATGRRMACDQLVGEFVVEVAAQHGPRMLAEGPA